MENDRLPTSKPLLLREVAYIKIKDAIMKGTFSPGTFLSESKLIDFLEMSKTPIKSAIDRLETEGFVTVAPKQGIIVSALSLQKVRDIFDLRIALESYVCETICGKLGDEQCKEVEDNLTRSEEMALKEDEAEFAKVDAEFHLLLSGFSGNKELYRTMATYQDHLYLNALTVLRKDTGRMSNSHKDHVNIFKALYDGKETESVTLMRDHLRYGQLILVH